MKSVLTSRVPELVFSILSLAGFAVMNGAHLVTAYSGVVFLVCLVALAVVRLLQVKKVDVPGYILRSHYGRKKRGLSGFIW